MQNSRETALVVLSRIETEQAYAGILLDAELRRSGLDARDRAFATELVYGVLRWQRTLDWYLEQKSAKPLKKLHPWLRRILRIGTYQLFFLDKIPASAAINESVRLAGAYGRKAKLPAQTAKGVVNGILRALQRDRETLRAPNTLADPVQRLCVTYAFPDWLVRRWIARFGEAGAEDACRINNTPARLSVRYNTLQTSAADLTQRLQSSVASFEALPYGLPGFLLEGHPPIADFAEYQQGLLTVQNASSMLIALLLDPQPGAAVLDACAGTGTKTTHLAERMRNSGRILALDAHAGKLERLRAACQRMAVSIVETACGDATQFTPPGNQAYDSVLVDAPCSGLGVLRRHPEATWTTQESDIRTLSQLQQRLLHQAAGWMTPGGVLVYSTCTTEPEENQQVIQAFLHTHPDVVTESAAPFLPQELHDSLTPEGWLLIDPPASVFDGFFGARLRKRVPNSA